MSTPSQRWTVPSSRVVLVRAPLIVVVRSYCAPEFASSRSARGNRTALLSLRSGRVCRACAAHPTQTNPTPLPPTPPPQPPRTPHADQRTAVAASATPLPLSEPVWYPPLNGGIASQDSELRSALTWA